MIALVLTVVVLFGAAYAWLSHRDCTVLLSNDGGSRWVARHLKDAEFEEYTILPRIRGWRVLRLSYRIDIPECVILSSEHLTRLGVEVPT